MLRQIKPKNARSKRALEKRAPKAIENPKTALFLRGTTCSQLVQDALSDLHSLRMPLAKKFTKKNNIHPFEDASSLEFFSEKNDASILVFGASNKKRPHAITFVRTFGHKVLDMLELKLDAESFRTMGQFKSRKFAVGLRPMMVFSGTAFESPVENEFTLAKSVLTDFFRGDSGGAGAEKIDVEGLQYIVSVTADEPGGEGLRVQQQSEDPALAPVLRLRVYLITTKRSGQRLPRVEVEEMGPRMDFRFGRHQMPDEAMLKEAMKRSKEGVEKTKKNISVSNMGDKIGRIHLGKQDLKDLQTRKMKGLKRGRTPEGDDEGVEDVIDDEDRPKRKRKDI
ncbi:rRNA-binding ribosome biosynthesis protein rpf2 [Coniochaeta pulveracea]|uniref:Ribosome production factor 2 homolog n=1 Tax=Coniochaeta pulveracea TaxID=177199 RepID=A0A420Y7G8_9PEZI|nr:rRNA-binding ribosome biosynthesis protein rpf2 [Coniochaeta pulveracea]